MILNERRKFEFAVLATLMSEKWEQMALTEENYLLAQRKILHSSIIDFSRVFGSDQAIPHRFM